MKSKSLGIVAVALFGWLLGTSASRADVIVYDNGAVDGTTEAWAIDSPYWVSNSFTLANATQLTSVTFGVWLDTTDTLTSVNWQILSGGPDGAAGGSVLFSGTGANTSGTFLSNNGYGYDIYSESFSLSPSLGAGNYWLQLSGALTSKSGRVYWDQNNGQSIAWVSALGYLSGTGYCEQGSCSHSFQIYGQETSVPEPGNALLLGLGLAGIGLTRRRKAA